MTQTCATAKISILKSGATLLLAFLSFGLTAQVALAGCCSCYRDDPNVLTCLTTTYACSDVISKVQIINPSLSGLTCDSDIDQGQCRTIPNGGVCSTVSTVEAFSGSSSSTLKEKYVPTIPQLNEDIPTLQFSNNVQNIKGIASVPYLAQYIAAFYRYLLGVTVITAGCVVVYGGFLYILGSTATTIKSGKDKIFGALIGLLLVVGATAILNLINPQLATVKPLPVNVVKHDDEFMAALDGTAGEGVPDPATLQNQINQAIQNGLPPTSTETGQQPVPQSTDWVTDTDGKQLWPKSCAGFQLSGNGNKPGTYTAMYRALAGKPHTEAGLAQLLTEWVDISKSGTFYARGIDSKKIIPQFSDNNKLNTFYFRWWIINQIYNIKKWRTTAMLDPAACGTDLPTSSSGIPGFFAKKANADRLLPCMNAVLDVYNNTYLKVAQCFDVYNNQCSGNAWALAGAMGKSTTSKYDFTYQGNDALLEGISNKEVKPGALIMINNAHHIMYTGGLGLSFEVIEIGGMDGSSYKSPSIKVKPGFFGETETSFGSGINTVATLQSYIANFPNPTYYVNNIW